jgi:hypothetical protein
VRISFPRHFLLLECVALLQVTVLGPAWTVAQLPLALQGALHALALAGAVSGTRALARRALFVACAALLASAAFYAGLWLDAAVDRLWHLSVFGFDHDTRLIALISAPGAIAYGFLVRAFWAPRQRRFDPLIIASGCTAVLIAADITLHLKEDWDIVIWWFSFSAVLYALSRRRASADDGLREYRA